MNYRTHLSVVADQKVLRLDVAVDHVLGVAIAQSVRDLLDVLRCAPLPAKMRENVRGTFEFCLSPSANNEAHGLVEATAAVYSLTRTTTVITIDCVIFSCAKSFRWWMYRSVSVWTCECLRWASAKSEELSKIVLAKVESSCHGVSQARVSQAESNRFERGL